MMSRDLRVRMLMNLKKQKKSLKPKPKVQKKLNKLLT